MVTIDDGDLSVSVGQRAHQYTPCNVHGVSRLRRRTINDDPVFYTPTRSNFGLITRRQYDFVIVDGIFVARQCV